MKYIKTFLKWCLNLVIVIGTAVMIFIGGMYNGATEVTKGNVTCTPFEVNGHVFYDCHGSSLVERIKHIFK